MLIAAPPPAQQTAEAGDRDDRQEYLLGCVQLPSVVLLVVHEVRVGAVIALAVVPQRAWRGRRGGGRRGHGEPVLFEIAIAHGAV